MLKLMHFIEWDLRVTRGHTLYKGRPPVLGNPPDWWDPLTEVRYQVTSALFLQLWNTGIFLYFSYACEPPTIWQHYSHQNTSYSFPLVLALGERPLLLSDSLPATIHSFQRPLHLSGPWAPSPGFGIVIMEEYFMGPRCLLPGLSQV